jgi:hypothetical protein
MERISAGLNYMLQIFSHQEGACTKNIKRQENSRRDSAAADRTGMSLEI